VTALRTLACALFVVSALCLTGCKKKAPAPAETQPVSYDQDTSPKPKPVVKPSAAQMAKVKVSFDEAGKLAAQARVLRKEAEALERADGREAAKDKYNAAKKLYRQALVDTEQWIEEDFEIFSQAQIDKYMRSFSNERAGWQKESAGMGKMRD